MNKKSKFLLCTLVASSVASFSVAQDVTQPKDIFEAARQGSLECVKRFVNDGADVNEHKYFGCISVPVLMCAIHGGSFDVVKFLVACGADVRAETQLADYSSWDPREWFKEKIVVTALYLTKCYKYHVAVPQVIREYAKIEDYLESLLGFYSGCCNTA